MGYFVGVGWVFTECSQRVRFLYVTYSPCKSMVFALQKYGFCVAKVWFLACKKGVFTLQKYGFCNAKVGILCILLCYSELQVYV